MKYVFFIAAVVLLILYAIGCIIVWLTRDMNGMRHHTRFKKIDAVILAVTIIAVVFTQTSVYKVTMSSDDIEYIETMYAELVDASSDYYEVTTDPHNTYDMAVTNASLTLSLISLCGSACVECVPTTLDDYTGNNAICTSLSNVMDKAVNYQALIIANDPCVVPTDEVIEQLEAADAELNDSLDVLVDDLNDYTDIVISATLVTYLFSILLAFYGIGLIVHAIVSSYIKKTGRGDTTIAGIRRRHGRHMPTCDRCGRYLEEGKESGFCHKCEVRKQIKDLKESV